MNVTGAQSTQNSYGVHTQQVYKSTIQSTTKSTTQTDSVSISEEAKAMESQKGKNIQELMAIPTWCVDLLPDSFKPVLGQKFTYQSKYEEGISNEYSRAVMQTLKEEVTNIETNTQLSYKEILDNDELNEELHQAVLAQITSNPRTSELMALMKEIGQTR